MPSKRKTDREIADRIVNSEAFKALNLLIDQRAIELEGSLTWFRERVELALNGKHQEGVSVRVSYEPGGRVNKTLPADPIMLKELGDLLAKIQHLANLIGDLQRFKLRLLNDYDFTSGNDAEQRAVFADVNG